MSRTATCFIALGISIALAAACGDDGGGTTGAGGSGGSGGSGTAGTANNAGSAGTGETAGAAGTAGGTGGTAGAGSGGSAGRAGTGGTAGGAGTAGNAGAGGAPPTDAGSDGSVAVDAGGGTGGTAPFDSGVNGNCPTLNKNNVFNGSDNSQSAAIAEVVFRGSTADVVIESTDDTNGFSLGGVFLCSSTDGTDTTCQDLSGDAGSTTIAGHQTLTLTGVTGLSPTAGELALTNDGDTAGGGFPNQIFAYIAWGTFPTGVSAMETTAVPTFWTTDDRILPVTNVNAIVANPSVNDAGTSSLAAASSFSTCNGDDF